jgi:glycosyltransferase involved in cell wall biosynthesis
MVVHFHGFDASENEILNKYSRGYINVFQYASAVIVVSNQMRKKIESLSCPPKKIKLIPYGPAEEYYEVVPICKDKQFVAVGRFVEKKAPYLTMVAFQKVLQYYPDAKLIMIGDGKLLPVCEHLSKVWHMESNISFKGTLQPIEIKKIFSQSIAFVQHSITASTGDMEGTPVAILEAAAASLPVISTNHAGIGDLIINNETGFLVDEFDVEAMANHMKSILDYPEKAREMGIKNKKNISENYTLENHLNQLRNTLNEIIVS